MDVTQKNTNGSNGAETTELENVNVKQVKRKRKHRKPDIDILVEPQVAEVTDVLTSRELLRVLTEVKNGNFSVRMPIDKIGINGKICDTLNEIISMNEKMIDEFTKAGNTIGKQGKLTQRIELPEAKGAWRTGVAPSIHLFPTWCIPLLKLRT